MQTEEQLRQEMESTIVIPSSRHSANSSVFTVPSGESITSSPSTPSGSGQNEVGQNITALIRLINGERGQNLTEAHSELEQSENRPARGAGWMPTALFGPPDPSYQSPTSHSLGSSTSSVNDISEQCVIYDNGVELREEFRRPRMPSQNNGSAGNARGLSSSDHSLSGE